MESVGIVTRNTQNVGHKHKTLSKPRVSREDIESYLGCINSIARTIANHREDELVKRRNGFAELPVDVQDYITDEHFMNLPTVSADQGIQFPSVMDRVDISSSHTEPGGSIPATAADVLVAPAHQNNPYASPLPKCTTQGARARRSLRQTAQRASENYVRSTSDATSEHVSDQLEVSSSKEYSVPIEEADAVLQPSVSVSLELRRYHEHQVNAAAIALQTVLLKSPSVALRSSEYSMLNRLASNPSENSGCTHSNVDLQGRNPAETTMNSESGTRSSRLRSSKFRSRRSSTESTGESCTAPRGSMRSRRRRGQDSFKKLPSDGTFISLPLERNIPEPMSRPTPDEMHTEASCLQIITGSENVIEENSVVMLKSPTKSIGPLNNCHPSSPKLNRQSLVDIYPNNHACNDSTSA